MEIKREVKISADSSEFEASVDRMGSSISDAFDRANDSINKATGSVGSISDKIKSKFDEMDKSSAKSFGSILKNAEKYNKSVSDRLRFMDKELRSIQSITREEEKRAKFQAKSMLDERKKVAETAKTHDEREFLKGEAQSDYQAQMKAIELRFAKRRMSEGGVAERINDYRNNNKEKITREENEKSSSGRGVGMLKVAAGAALGAAGYSFITSLGGWIGKFISEGMDLDVAKGKAGGLSRSGGGLSISSGTQFGLKDADMINFTAGVAKQMGVLRGAGGEAGNQLMFETRTGLERGQLGALSGALRQSGQGSAYQATQEMLNIFKKSKVFGIEKGDLTMVSDKLSDLNDLNTKQITQRDSVDNKLSSNLMANFAQIGGNFKFQQGATIGTMNQAITNPGNDFKKAFIFRALKDTMPNSSSLDILMKQEQGIFGKGTMNSILKRTVGISGDKDTQVRNIAAITGLKLFESQRLLEHYKQNPNAFNGDFTQDKMDAIIGGGKVGTVQRWQAKTDSWMGLKGESSIKGIDEYIKAYEKDGMGGIMAKLGNDIVDGFERVLNKFFGYKNDSEEKRREDRVGEMTGVDSKDAKILADTKYGDYNVVNTEEEFKQQQKALSRIKIRQKSAFEKQASESDREQELQIAYKQGDIFPNTSPQQLSSILERIHVALLTANKQREYKKAEILKNDTAKGGDANYYETHDY